MNFPIGYGHEIKPQETASEPETQELAAEPLTASQPGLVGISRRKRARVKGGQFAADDPVTAVDEAWMESSNSKA